jgi:hypothetical protein
VQHNESESNTRNGLHRVSPRDIGFFVDNVVLPSLHKLYETLNMTTRNAITPFSQQQEFLAHRTGNSHMSSSVNVVGPGLWPQLEKVMRQCIRELPDDEGMLFHGFKFYSFVHGVKSPLYLPIQVLPVGNSYDTQDVWSPLLPRLQEAFQDLDWANINHGNVFVDLAFEFHGKDHVGLWRLCPPSSKYPKIFHYQLLKMLVGKKLVQQQYTRYDFGGVKNVGGCKYVSNNIKNGSGPLKIHKIIAYQPLKEHFVRKDVSSKDARWNLNQTCSPEDVWTMSKRFLDITVSFFEYSKLY